MAKGGGTGLDQSEARGLRDVFDLEEKGESVVVRFTPTALAEPNFICKFAADRERWCVAEKWTRAPGAETETET